MDKSEHVTAQLEAEAKQWMDRLLCGVGKDRQHAASELSRLGVWTRGSVRTRGSLTTAAKNRLPEPGKLAELASCLGDANKAVRCQVASVLGEWGGQDAAVALRRLLQSDPDEDVRLYCITALRTIGGPAAIEGLRYAMENGTDAIREAAILGIEELATGGRVEDTEGPIASGPIQARATIRTRGAVRARGKAQKESGRSIIDGVVSALEHARDDDAAPEYLRLRADEVLGYLRG
jgi:HEAT repeat protein